MVNTVEMGEGDTFVLICCITLMLYVVVITHANEICRSVINNIETGKGRSFLTHALRGLEHVLESLDEFMNVYLPYLCTTDSCMRGKL